jgi:hypothetical protein
MLRSSSILAGSDGRNFDTLVSEVDAAERYAVVVKALCRSRGVTADAKRGFGAGALKTNDRIFAMLASGDRFVVKLPRSRVDSLVDAHEGQRYDPRHDGRLMKEWLVVGSIDEAQWLALAKEALRFVRG